MIRLTCGTDFAALLRRLMGETATMGADLADAAGLREDHISMLRWGKRTPERDTLIRLANALGYDLALVPRDETAPSAALREPQTAEQPSAQGVDGSGPETGTAGATGERAREDA